MRTIKFRAWDGRKYDYSPTIWDGMVWNPVADCEMEGVILEQFTGLTDKNGVEIWEGDVVTGLFGNSVVGFGWGEDNEGYMDSYGWLLNNISRKSSCIFGNAPETFKEIHEVIGNIHENPELCLKK
jgi:uncharacterized phage protein (TIGR01671 family)